MGDVDQGDETPDVASSDIVVEQVEISGHIIDSLILPKILDVITTGGGTFQIVKITVGQNRSDPSYALVEVRAADAETLEHLLAKISDHGAVPTHTQDARLVEADIAGTFPEGFYSTTNQRTEVKLDGQWTAVDDQEMDCGIRVHDTTVHCVPMTNVSAGDPIVVGHAGVRVFPHQRATEAESFEFMGSDVSTEKPKRIAVRRIAEQLAQVRRAGGKTLLVGGPAIIHTDSIDHFVELIRGGYVDKLFAGNALATHDIEHAMFGTSLGVHLREGNVVQAGHEHHLRAINRIRRAGGIAKAVASGILTQGIMYECIQAGVEVTLAGSIRDDGPLPEVITDTLEAQATMRERVRDVSFCLMIATALHSIATGNLLPAWVNVVCVDINPSTVTKLADRGSFQTVGLVTDVEPFMRELVQELAELENNE
jgi:lysine-ketoglutarate reductase/saccharopine dehydrogenase-like protein (TIGR00300 family)